MRSPRFPRLVIFWILFFLFSPGRFADDLLASEQADPEIQSLVRLVNEKRKKSGCPELRWDDRLTALALDHSRDMGARHFFSHTNPDGKDPFDRLKEANLRYSAAAENMALGVRTGRDVYALWIHSPEHRRNMLDCRFTRHGIGRDGDRWTHLLFNP